MIDYNKLSFEQYLILKIPNITEDNKLIIPEAQQKTFMQLENQPRLAVSNLAKLFQYEGLSYIPIDFDRNYNREGWLAQLEQTDMFSSYPGVYALLATCYLEIYALNWHIGKVPQTLTNISAYDIQRVRYNLNVLADWCGNYQKYYPFIVKLRQLEVDLGFLENKTEYIVNHYGYKK